MSLLPMLAMRAAVRSPRMATFLQQNRTMAGYWNQDWRPADKLPETEEEKRAAAKKYGMIPDDYEPYPADGTGYGDYPRLPKIGAESRDPHALYDIPELKRNYGEPLPVDADMIGEDRWNINQRLRYGIWFQAFCYVSVMSLLAVGFLIGEHVRFHPVRMMPKHTTLYDGKKFYSFELEDVE